MNTEEIIGSCTICGSHFYEGESAFGLSAGMMRKDAEGFAPSDFCPWDEIICGECMDAVDKALLGVREELNRLRSEQERK